MVSFDKSARWIHGKYYKPGTEVAVPSNAKVYSSGYGEDKHYVTTYGKLTNKHNKYYAMGTGFSKTPNAPYNLTSDMSQAGYWFGEDAFPYATFTVSFNANGGSVTTESKKVTYDSNYGTLPTPTRTGYQFNGWYTETSGGSKITSSSTVSITDNQILYAQWTVNSYSYTLGSATGATTTGSTASGSQNYGTTITLKGAANTGYTWNKWKSSNTDIRADITTANTTFSMPAGNLTMTPVVTANTYTVTYNANGGTGTMAQSTVTYDSSFRTEQNTFTRTGYTFNGWNEEANGTGTAWGLTDEGVYESGKSSQWTYDKNITLYAQWLPNMYRMVLDCQGGKTQDGEESVQYNAIFDSFVGGLNYGQSLPIPTRPSYNFIGWNDKEDGEGVYYTGSETMNVVGGMVLYAIWEPAASLVTIYVDGQPRRGMMHMYNSSGELCYAIMTVYDETGNPHLTV